MSKYAVVKTEYSDFRCLLMALEQMYGRGVVETGGLVALGYGGQQQKAEIVIRRNVVGGYGDLGFRKNKNGKYEMIVDDLLKVNHQKLTRMYLEHYIRLKTGGKFRILSSSDDKIELQVIE